MAAAYTRRWFADEHADTPEGYRRLWRRPLGCAWPANSRVFRKLGVRSQQELIDLLRNGADTAVTD